MKPPSHLRALQALELTIRTGSLKAAAAELGITPAAAGQRVKALEDYLGFDLLVRGRFGVGPGPALGDAMQDLRAGFAHLEAVAASLDFQRVQEIHIVADPDWAELWLLPRLDAFRACHRSILFCINGTGDVPMRPGQADCTVSLAADAGGAETDVLYRDYMWAIASPENFARVADRPEGDRLEQFPLVHINSYSGDIGWPEFVRALSLNRSESPDRGVRYQRVVQGIDAIRADVGLILCGASLTTSTVATNLAKPLLSEPKGVWANRSYQASYRPAALRRLQVLDFRNWLTDESLRTQGELEVMARQPRPS